MSSDLLEYLRRRNAGAPGTGSCLTADPVSEHEALTVAAHSAERKALTALREH